MTAITPPRIESVTPGIRPHRPLARALAPLALALAFTLAGCDVLFDDGGSGSATDVSGFVSKAPVSGASCTLYDSRNVAIAGPISSSNGEVRFVAAPISAGSMATISCTGGAYTDEATGATVDAPVMRGANTVAGSAPLIVVTPLTELALRKSGGDLAKVADNAKLVARAMGLGDSVDILSTKPTDLNKQAASSSANAADEYGVVLAGLARLTQTKSQGDTVAKVIDSLEKTAIKTDGTFADASVTSNLKSAVNDLATLANAKVKANLSNSAAQERVKTNLDAQPQPSVDAISADPGGSLIYGSTVTIRATGSNLTTATVSLSGGSCQAAQVTATTISATCTVGSSGQTATVSINYGGAVPATKSFTLASAGTGGGSGTGGGTPTTPATPSVTSVAPTQASYNATQAFTISGVFTGSTGAVTLDGASCSPSLSGSTITASCAMSNDRSKTSQTLSVSGYGLASAYTQAVTLTAPAVVLSSSSLTTLTQNTAGPASFSITGTGFYSGLTVKLNNSACRSNGTVNTNGTQITGIDCSNVTLPTGSTVALSLAGSSMPTSGNTLSISVSLTAEPAASFNGWGNGNPLTCTLGAACSNTVSASNCGTGAAVSYSIAAADQQYATVNASTGAVTTIAATTSAITVTATQAAVAGQCSGGSTSYSLNVSARPTATVSFATASPAALTWAPTQVGSTWQMSSTNAATAACGATALTGVTYSSSNATLAPVSTAGVVTVKQAGSYTITAAVAQTSSCAAGSATYTLTVNQATPALSFASSSKTLTFGATGADLNSPALSGVPADGTGAVSYACTYSNTDTPAGSDGCTVNNSGVLTLTKPGTGTVTATLAADSNYNRATASYSLTVNAPAANPPANTCPVAADATFDPNANVTITENFDTASFNNDLWIERDVSGYGAGFGATQISAGALKISAGSWLANEIYSKALFDRSLGDVTIQADLSYSACASSGGGFGYTSNVVGLSAGDTLFNNNAAAGRLFLQGGTSANVAGWCAANTVKTVKMIVKQAGGLDVYSKLPADADFPAAPVASLSAAQSPSNYTNKPISFLGGGANTVTIDNIRITGKTRVVVPQDVFATPADGAVTVQWTPDSLPLGGMYTVEYRPSACGTWKTLADKTTASGKVRVTGLANGTAYDFRVRTAGTATASAVVSATPAATATGLSGLTDEWGPNDVAVFIAAGQSNSVGRSYLDAADQITTALPNVWVAQSDNANDDATAATYQKSNITWSSFTGGSNPYLVFEETSFGSRTSASLYNLANSPAYLAKSWQTAINAGTRLPDLYIIHVARGGQGIDCSAAGAVQWCPSLTADATGSLYYLSQHLIRLAVKDLTAAGKRPRFLGVDWDQWEQDSRGGATAIANYPANLQLIVDAMSNAAGTDLPFWFHKPVSPSSTYSAATMRPIINTFVNADPTRYHLIDTDNNTTITGAARFLSDQVHYTAGIQKWMAQQIWEDITTNNRRGVYRR